MSGNARPSDRLHGFDAVRGSAAAAVVLLHAAYAYSLAPLPGLVWPVPLDQPSRFADAVWWAIEGAVMPLFFAVSGYFAARSLARQSPAQVAAGRTRRLLLPMATVGAAVLVVDFHVWVLGLVATGRATGREYLRMKFAPAIQADLFGPGHLWYVEYVWLMCVLLCGAAWAVGRGSRDGRRGMAIPRLLSRTALPTLLVAVAALLAARPQVVLGFQHGWLPDPAKFAHGTAFFLAGALLFREPRLLEAVRRFALPLLAVAAGTYAAMLPRIGDAMAAGPVDRFDPTLGTLLALYAFATTFGIVGAGLRWLDRPSPRFARLAAASFWVYLVHHPLVGLAQVGLRGVPLPPAVKFLLVTAGVLGLCGWTYVRFVEGRAIGRLLDGEWPSRTKPEPAPQPAAEPQPAERRRAA